MPRSIWKGPFVDSHLIRKSLKDSKKPIKTYSRRSTIIPIFIGKTFLVYNGNKFIKIFIKENMLNYKLGAFSPTRKPTIHKKKQ